MSPINGSIYAQSSTPATESHFSRNPLSLLVSFLYHLILYLFFTPRHYPDQAVAVGHFNTQVSHRALQEKCGTTLRVVHHHPLGIGSRLLCHSLSTSACLVSGARAATTGGDDAAASPEESASTWRKPAAGQLKLNFDGWSKRECQSASIGGAYRDHEGRFVLGYAEPIGAATSSVAELAALRRGLELAVASGWRSVWIEGDNKTVVDVVRSRARLRRSQEDLRLWGEIEALLPLLDDMSVSHVRREGNCVAHGFAKLGHEVESPRVWRDVPPNEVLSCSATPRWNEEFSDAQLPTSVSL